MLASLLAQAPQTDGEVVVELTGCEDTRSPICDLVLEATGNQAAADAVYLLIGKPLRIRAHHLARPPARPCGQARREAWPPGSSARPRRRRP